MNLVQHAFVWNSVNSILYLTRKVFSHFIFFFFFKEKGLYLNDFAIVSVKRPIIGIEPLLVVQFNLLKNSFSIDLTDFLTEILMDAGSVKLPM